MWEKDVQQPQAALQAFNTHPTCHSALRGSATSKRLMSDCMQGGKHTTSQRSLGGVHANERPNKVQTLHAACTPTKMTAAAVASGRCNTTEQPPPSTQRIKSPHPELHLPPCQPESSHTSESANKTKVWPVPRNITHPRQVPATPFKNRQVEAVTAGLVALHAAKNTARQWLPDNNRVCADGC